MSYLVLARKYRPKSFETLVGQDHVVRALTHALDSGRLHHAYLFTGTRGVGKTTLSRILAKSFNCESGVTSKPCGTCAACTAIDADRFVDYIEMDAASNRGIGDMLQLLEQAVYAPTNARFKVYMIDEVHMLTAQAFNAMLKTLEEPPPYIKFILATTDPQKIPVTVLSRCLQFNLKQMPPVHIIDHLDSILGLEQVGFEKPALRLLAQAARGSMRDALSLTDQAIAYTAGNVTLEAVQGMLGALDQTYLIRLLDALAAMDGAGLLAVADEMAARSLSYSVALQDLGTLLHRIALAQSVPTALPEDLPEREDVLRLASLFDPEEVQLFYQIAVHGRNELGLAPDEYAGFSMTLLRLLAFRPATDEAPAAAAPDAKPSARSSGGNPAQAALSAARARPQPADAVAVQKPAAVVEQKPVVERKPLPAEVGDLPPWMDAEPAFESAPAFAAAVPEKADAPQEAAAPANSSSPAFALNAAASPDIGAAPPSAVATLNWDGDWPPLAAALPLRGVAQQLAQQTELVKWEHHGESASFHLRVPIETLCSATNVNRLATALSDHFGLPVRVATEIGKVEQTANKKALEERAVRQRQAEESLQSDPVVQALVREFGASIVPGSIKPA
jgi:DNA polymerase-3 subunit gamma/tau